MKRSVRYILYLILGFVLYYITGVDKDPEALAGVHRYAPAAILVLIVLLIVVRYINRKGEKKEEK